MASAIMDFIIELPMECTNRVYQNPYPISLIEDSDLKNVIMNNLSTEIERLHGSN